MDKEKKGIENTGIQRSMNVTPHVEIKGDYNKQVRNRIDNPTKRKRFTEDSFAGKKTIKDPYTGKTIHKNAEAAVAKYGKDKSREHIPQVDHTIPLEEVHKRTKDNPFLSEKDIKEIANQEENYKVINARTNQSKQSNSNSKYVKKHKGEISQEQVRKMKQEQIKAEVAVNKEIVAKTVGNAHEIGLNAGIEGMKFGGAVSVASNSLQVIKGEKDIPEAVMQIGLDTAKAGAVSYGTAITKEVVEGVAVKATAKAGEQLALGITQFINNGGPAKVVVVLTDTSTTLIKYLKGDITGEQCIEELGEKGSALAMSFAGGKVGAGAGIVVGEFIGGIAGSVLPGLGTVIGAGAGAAVGAVVGEIVGNIVGYMLGSVIYRTLKEFKAKSIPEIERLRKLEGYYHQLGQEIIESRKALEQSLQQVHFEHREIIYNAFTSMRNGIESNDVEQITVSLQTICEQFGTAVAFKNREDFDKVIFDPNKTIKIGM